MGPDLPGTLICGWLAIRFVCWLAISTFCQKQPVELEPLLAGGSKCCTEKICKHLDCFNRVSYLLPLKSFCGQWLYLQETMMCISSRCDCEKHLWWAQGRACAKYASKKNGSIFHLTISLATIATIGHTQLRSTANFELGFLTITFNLTGRGHFSRRKYLSHPSKEGRRVGGRRWRLLVCSYGDWGGQREKGEAGTRGESGAGYRVSLLLWNLSTQSLLTQDSLLNF